VYHCDSVIFVNFMKVDFMLMQIDPDDLYYFTK